MKVNNAIELIQQKLAKGEAKVTDNFYHSSLVKQRIAAAANKLVEVYLMEQWKMYKTRQFQIDGVMVKPFNDLDVSVSGTDKTVTLPAPIMHVDLALRMVSTTGNEADAFTIIKPSDKSIVDNLDIGSTDIMCYLEWDKIHFINLPDQVTKVSLKMIPDVMGLTDDEHIPVPSGKDEDLVNMVVQWFYGDIADLDNNENPNNQ